MHEVKELTRKTTFSNADGLHVATVPIENSTMHLLSAFFDGHIICQNL
jgi:hypothetical protein